MPAKPIYLDYAAATPVDKRVLDAMLPYFSDYFYNPSATYSVGLEVRKAFEAARATVAHWLGAKSSEIIFTAGASEANNIIIHGVMRQYAEDNILVSGIEHESVLKPAQNYDCRQISVRSDGRLDVNDLKHKIDNDTVLISVMYANNEIGTVQPIKEIAAIVAEVRRQRGHKGKPLYLHTDAAQAANYLDLHVARLGVDFMSINGGKIYGPKQSGAIYIKSGIKILPLVHGGGQERGLRSGTENVAGAIGLAAALEIAQTDRRAESARLNDLQQEFFAQIEAKLPDASINGSLKWRLPNNVHLTLPGKDNERLLFALDQNGVLAAAGSACSASNDIPSHVLATLGLSDDQARSSLRFTMGRDTTRTMVKKTVQILAGL